MKIDNVNIQSEIPIKSPDQVKGELPLPESAENCVLQARETIQNILLHKDPRHLLIAGPCSIHDPVSALEYAGNLKRVSDEVSEQILIVMRVYFEKPRTTVGWKGFIYDPGLDGSDRVDDGLFMARRLLLDITELGLPCATEFLDPIVPQYIADLISWAAIGARTAESQTHRQMASGLSMPVGFKNATDGGISVAVNAIKAASSGHSFLGVTGEGRSAVFKTSGNAFGHLVLRGGDQNPNYGSEYIAFSRESLRKTGIKTGIIVDCSHANSGKDPEKQTDVMNDVIEQIRNGNCPIVGTMLESHLETGNQSLKSADPNRPGLSVTDACLGWDKTEKLINKMAESLKNRK